tara:strand:+ start:670 stop:4545 length:3876 start_codon:yes stop_codon:yes gene_type:complete
MTKDIKLIKGSGGGPSPPPPPYRAPDTLHSRSFATIQDLISEGEIEGFASASKEERTKGTTAYQNASLKDVFLDDTPILSADANSANPVDGDFNFQDITFKSKFGEGNQTAMTGIPAESRSPTGVGTVVENTDEATSWTASKSYTVGNIVSSTSAPRGIVFRCSVAGQSGTTEPTAFASASQGQTISDNNITWVAQIAGLTGAVTRQITNTDVDAVIVTLTWPQIQVAEDDGDIRGDTVEYRIQIRQDNGSFVDKIGGAAGEAVVSGRTADAYARDHRIELTSGFTTVDIRVSRITRNSTDTARVNSFQFTSFQEVIDNNSTYPNSAYVALRLDSKQFNRIPTRKYRVRGIKVRIPGAGANNSGTPSVDLATGRIDYPPNYIFNGVMGQAVYTNCPAMCLLDLLTNSRYGFGDNISPNFDPDNPSDSDLYENLDLFSFVAASQHSNALVDDGSGSGTKEARFSCNVNIQSPQEAFDAINELSGVMMCMPIWSAGSVTISQDKEITSSYLFNLSNVSENGFSYSGSSLKQRHSIFSVSYFNMDSKEIDFEVVGDSESAADVARREKLGTSIKKVKAFACTSRNQAARLGRAMMFAEERQSEVITFNTSIDAGIVVRPGSVIDVNDPVRAGARRGGRIVFANNARTQIRIDAVENTSLPALNDNPKVSVILPNGTIESRTITNINNNRINVSPAFSLKPNVNSPYLLTSDTLQTQQFRVLQVEEKDEINYQITAITYEQGKYNFIEDDIPLPPRTISILNAPASSPTGLTVTEKTVVINNIARSKLIVDWQPVQGVTQYQVNYKLENGNYVSQVVFSSDFELLDTVKGTYTIQVFSYNAALTLSTNPAETTYTAVGKTALPENVSSLTIEPINEQFVRLRFTQATAIDVLHGGRVYIRHSNQTGNNATFQSAQDIIEAVAGNTTEVIAPALAGTYLLKFQDDGGRFSSDAAKIQLSLVDILDSITVKEDREDTDTPTFNNTTSSLFTNTQYDSVRGGLVLSDPSAIISGTYSQATNSTTITCTINSHGLSQGEFLNFRFTSGDAVNGKFLITSVTNANVFVITAQKSLASELIHTGNVSVDRGLRGTYDFKDTLDLGGVFSLNLKRYFQGTGFYVGDRFDNRIDLIDTWTDFDGTVANDANAKLVVRTTPDNPSGSPTYSEFNDVANGTFKGRAFQFRAILETNDAAQNTNLQQLGYFASMPVRTEQSSVIASGAGAKTVTFAAAFFVGTSDITGIPKPSVNISPQNMQTGDFYELLDSNISGTQFIIHFKNSSGASIDRNFTYSAVGFGKGG